VGCCAILIITDVRYCEHGRYLIDTKPTENAFRTLLFWPRNWLFSGTVVGAKSNASLYWSIETARANGLVPYGCLRKVFSDLPSAKTAKKIEALLSSAVDPNFVKPQYAQGQRYPPSHAS
jgi:hypothetical protein